MIVINDLALTPYSIEVEESQYNLIKNSKVVTGANAGSAKAEAIGHYTSLDRLLAAVVKLNLVSTGRSHTLKTYIAAYREGLDELKEILKKAGLE
jgi:hypothetical protein